MSRLPRSFSRSPKCRQKRCIVFFLLGWKNVAGLGGRHSSFFPCGFLIPDSFIYTSPKPLGKHSFLCKCRDLSLSLWAPAPRSLRNVLEHCWTSNARVSTQTRGRVTRPTEFPVSRPGHRAPQGDVAASLASRRKAEGAQQRRCAVLCCGHGHGPPAGPPCPPCPRARSAAWRTRTSGW